MGKRKKKVLSLISRDLTALNRTQKRHRKVLENQFLENFEEYQSLPGGYAFLFPGDPSSCLKVVEFITLERLCCPFLTITLEFEPDNGPIWVCITGGEGVKEFLEEEFGIK